MAAHANDVVLLPIIFIPISKLRSLSVEDNFNNTFLLKNNSFATAVTWSYCKNNKGVLFYQDNCRKNFLISLLVSVMQIVNKFICNSRVATKFEQGL